MNARPPFVACGRHLAAHSRRLKRMLFSFGERKKRLLAAARSPLGSDSHSGCHSLPRGRFATKESSKALYSPYACFRCLRQPVHANSGEGVQSIGHQALYTYSRCASHNPCGSTIQERLRREKAVRRQSPHVNPQCSHAAFFERGARIEIESDGAFGEEEKSGNI